MEEVLGLELLYWWRDEDERSGFLWTAVGMLGGRLPVQAGVAERNGRRKRGAE